MRNTVVGFSNTLQAIPYFASLGNEVVIGVDHNKCSEHLVILRFSIFFRPIRSTIVRFVPVLHYFFRVSDAFRPHSFLERQM
jgi:hypothetical protein